MPAEISIDRLPEARARLAAMPRDEVEAVALRALFDAAIFCVGASELQLAILDVGDLLCNGAHDLAQGRLEDALAANVKASASVPPRGEVGLHTLAAAVFDISSEDAAKHLQELMTETPPDDLE